MSSHAKNNNYCIRSISHHSSYTTNQGQMGGVFKKFRADILEINTPGMQIRKEIDMYRNQMKYILG